MNWIPATLDLTNQAHYVWALLPEIFLSLWLMGLLIADVWQKGSRSAPSGRWVPWAAIVGLVITGVLNTLLFGVRDDSATGMVAVDGFRLMINYVFLLAAALSILISIGYLDRRNINRAEFHALVLAATLGMMLMAGARDLMLMFIGLEVMSVSIYVLVGFDRLEARSTEAALKYFLLGAFASAFFLYGIALVFGATGTTNLRTLHDLLLNATDRSPMLLGGMALLMIGFAFKVAAMPFHMWTPDAYEGAPTPVTALMATGVKAAAFAAFIRVFVGALRGYWSEEWGWPVFVLAAITMIGGNLVAMTQGSVKRMLAYSSIAHAGYLLAALLAGANQGTAAFLFYLLVYTLMTAGAFGIVIANSRGGEEKVTLEDYAGLAHQKPLLAALFSVFLLSLAGFPLTAGFLGKLYILQALVSTGVPQLAVILVLASLISYFYYLRVIVVMYMRPARTGDEHREAGLSGPAMFGVSAAAAAVVLLFFLAGVKNGPVEQARKGEAALDAWVAGAGAPRRAAAPAAP
ncbi:MAG TPA: NADH-quinone oxidoreductase subunit N [Longimicrobium sp.]|nr:NADH-quinone oxidoreductase subunit N [Longimicrobium sp.]